MLWVKREPKIQYDKNDDIVTKLAKINGIYDVKEFLEPSRNSLHDPMLLRNIDVAAREIVDAVENKKKIAISFDVDADGITAGAAMFLYLKSMGADVYYTYAQRSMGHGIENQVHMLHPDTDLLIICDSSSNSVDACKHISDLGTKIIIIDHHIVERENPYVIMVNPQTDEYPNKELSGAGVVYKVLQVLDSLLGVELADNYLDLVAVGMLTDVMSVAEPENRYLIKTGLENIQNEGLRALLKVNSVSEDKVNSQTVGFTIGPMLNGAARMDRIELAIRLLTENDFAVCKDLALEIKYINDERKKIERTYFEEALELVDENDKIIVVVKNIDKGFNGLIAAKLAEAYKRPAIVLNDEGAYLSGSYRSYANFDMKNFLEQFYVTDFVIGHRQAGGVSVKKEHLPTLKKLINDKLRDFVFETKIEYDLELDVSEITTDLIRDVEKFSWITGKDVPQPKFVVKNLFVVDVQVLGKNRDTVKVVCDGIDLMKFRTNEEYANNFVPFTTIDAIGTLNVNEFYSWKEKKIVITNQLFIDDFRVVN